MKRMFVMGMLASLAAALSAGCATTPPTGSPETGKLASSASKPLDSHCVRDTGSRIKMPADQCAPFGRSWTKDELDETGRISMGEALRQLDPRLQ